MSKTGNKETNIDPYKVLCLNYQELFSCSMPSLMDAKVKENLVAKLQEFQARIRANIDNMQITLGERLDEIEKIIPEILECLCAYSKIKDSDSRENFANGKLPTISEELENLKRNLEQTLRILNRNGPRDKDGNSKPLWRSAYQILGRNPDIDEKSKKEIRKSIRQKDENKGKKEEELDKEAEQKIQQEVDRKIRSTIYSKLGTSVTPGAYRTLEELENMIGKVFENIWAYSKLKTSAKRELYKAEHEIFLIGLDSNEEKMSMGTVESKKFKNPISVVLEQAEDGTPKIILSEIGKLQQGIKKANGDILLPDEVKAYRIQSHLKGEKNQSLFFSWIDMRRLDREPEYRSKVLDMVSDPQTILFAQRHLGGYIGEISSSQDNSNGESARSFKLGYDLTKVALCRKYREQLREKTIVKNEKVTPIAKENEDSEDPQQ